MDAFKQAAAKAALDYIQPATIVGFGAGSTIAFLIGYLKERPELAAGIKGVTASYNTALLLEQEGIAQQSIADTTHLDLYFDGCDQFDHSLNALKSGGGVHTREKLLASMAQRFIIIGDGSKYVPQFYPTVPLVLEVIPEAVRSVLHKLRAQYDTVNPVVRLAQKKDGAVITENGNLLIDLWFTRFPALEELNIELRMMPGVLETSLFYGMAHEAIIAGKDGVEVKQKP